MFEQRTSVYSTLSPFRRLEDSLECCGQQGIDAPGEHGNDEANDDHDFCGVFHVVPENNCSELNYANDQGLFIAIQQRLPPFAAAERSGMYLVNTLFVPRAGAGAARLGKVTLPALGEKSTDGTNPNPASKPILQLHLNTFSNEPRIP